jgi:hypothetical protein
LINAGEDTFPFPMKIIFDGFLKSPPVRAPHSSFFARLASGAFYKAIVIQAFYEILIFEA